jgi:EmrB/QacA subfamily drug resistance transporter
VDSSRRQRLTLVATILGSTVVFLDGTVVNVALPAISNGLHAGLAGQQWVVEAYLLALVSLLLVGGSLGDQFGRRRMFVAGLVGFGATSALCAVAPSDELLVAARALQGMAGALLVPGSLAIVAATFEGERRGVAVGTWTAWTGIATVLGPAGGGALIDALSWRWIFWVNVPLIVATVLLTLRVVEESRDPDAAPGIDWIGIALSAAGLGGPVFALIEQPTYGWSDPLVLVPLGAGLACFAAFVAYEARAEHPMLDLTLFRVRNFAVANLTTLCAYAGLIGGFFFIGLFLQQTAGYSPFQAGLATTPVSLILFVLSPRFGRIASGTGPRLPMTFGPIVAGIGVLLLLRVDSDPAYLTDVLPAIVIFGLGLAATVAPLTATVLDSVEERHVGIASGVNNGVARVAGLLAIAVLGAVISARFDAALEDQFAGAALGPSARSAIADARAKPLGAAKTARLASAEARRVDAGVSGASVSAFHLGVGLAGSLLVLGGLVSAVGIVDPRRRVTRVVPRAAMAGDCGQAAGSEHAREAAPIAEPAREAALTRR